MEYDIYHDESKEDAYWHCFLFIPKENRSIILEELKEIRSKIEGNIHFCQLNSKKAGTKINGCKSLLSTISSSFQQVDKGKMEPFFKYNKTQYCNNSKRKFSEYGTFQISPKVKIAIFHQKNNHDDMNFGDALSRIETTFRMGLQGAKHYLFNDNEKIIVDGIYIDGFEHYKIASGREFDIDKVKQKLVNNSRDYVTFKESFHILDGKINDDDKLFLDIIDLFLGTFRLNYLFKKGDKSIIDDNRYILFKSIEGVINKMSDGPIRMKNSRFKNFGSFSSGSIEKGVWKFENIIEELKKFEKNSKKEKDDKIMSLF
ncbi:MAG: hypothetical protein PHV23_05350 [Candidatus Gracilibacteria bacterium]|nr:hypothetical protein [Candidatus Gracilibacteria bacterium]